SKTKEAVMQLASLEKSPLTLWSRAPRRRFDSFAIGFSPEENSFYLDPAGSENFIRDTAGRDVFCHMRIGVASIFFLGRLTAKENSLQLKLRKHLYEVQRRGSLRLNMTGSEYIAAELNLGPALAVQGKILDLSSTGAKILLPN